MSIEILSFSNFDIIPDIHVGCYPILLDSSLAPVTMVHELHDCDYLALLHVQNFGHSHGGKHDLLVSDAVSECSRS